MYGSSPVNDYISFIYFGGLDRRAIQIVITDFPL